VPSAVPFWENFLVRGATTILPISTITHIKTGSFLESKKECNCKP